MNLRDETTADFAAIRQINRLAFGREDEARLVDALRDGGYARLSRVAEMAGQVVGHILFSDLPIVTDRGEIQALALAPLAVLPDYQGRGIGGALIRDGLAACRAKNHAIVVVLGHPHFYPRFGFSAELAAPLAAPFSGEAWMAIELIHGALAGVAGTVQCPPPFAQTN